MEIVNTLFGLMAANSPFVVDAILLSIIVYLLWERVNLNKIIDHQTSAMKELSKKYNDEVRMIVEKYHKGNIELAQALNEIKVVLTTLIRNV